jgi:hypothetical protein
MKGNTTLLIVILVALGGSLYISYSNLQQVHLLRQENSMLWEKLDSVQQIVNKKPVKQKAALKTKFNYDSDKRGTNQSGTITYIFTSKK